MAVLHRHRPRTSAVLACLSTWLLAPAPLLAQVRGPAGQGIPPQPAGWPAGVPTAVLPPPPAPLGLPLLQAQPSCSALQSRLQASIGSETPVWSVTIADAQGRVLADLNGRRPRIPASNQKLISTAFALDRLGPDHRLTTRLWRLPTGELRLTGEGDPDFALPQLQRIAKLASGTAGGDDPSGTPVLKLQLAEEPQPSWWPRGWPPDDRLYAYGAPITRLALTSNAIDMAIANPPARLQRLLKQSFAREGSTGVQFSLVPARSQLPQDAVLLHEEPSAPMFNLLSLANTESHNFTSEVLLRQAAGSWDLPQVQQAAMAWLAAQGLPMESVRVVDGSGLDRANRVTSRLLASLLLRMAQHPYAAVYQASMAVAGQRGTLRNLWAGSSLDGRFRGKTGTISGVRSISGILSTADGPLYVSLISNGAGAPNGTIGEILRAAQTPGLCRNPF